MGSTSSRLEMHHIAPIASPCKFRNIRGQPRLISACAKVLPRFTDRGAPLVTERH